MVHVQMVIHFSGIFRNNFPDNSKEFLKATITILMIIESL